MRTIEITTECLEFIDDQDDRVIDKFFQLLEVMSEIKVVNSNFVKKLQSTDFYELRIKAGNEYKVVLFTFDHSNFIECTKLICLYGFQKKSTKDYKKAIRKAENILADYLKNNDK
ncbi:MAG: type II toxin-antitoxin system RelE/ParE family toxin [Bacteroidota bacterium]